MPPSPEQIIAEYISQCSYGALHVDAIAATKRAIVDGFAVMAAGSSAKGIDALVQHAHRSGGDGQARIVCSTLRTSPAHAAWANAVQLRALELDDCTDFAPSHPSAAILPALIAVAETTDISGADFLRALVIAQDLAVRFYMTVKSSVASGRNDMHRVFSATAGVAAALGLSAAETQNALGLATAYASGDMQSSFEGSMSSWVQTGNSARGAVEACRLSKVGISGPSQFLTGRAGYLTAFEPEHRLEKLLAQLGEVFQGALIAIKPYAACRAQHAIIDMARALRDERGAISPDEVASIEIVVSPPVYNLVGAPEEKRIRPRTAHDAQFSAYFAAGVGLVHGAMGLQACEAPILTDSRVLALAAKVRVIPSEQNLTHEIIGRTDMSVQMQGGQTYAQSCDSPLGGPRNPMSPHALRAKWDDCIAYADADIDATARDRFMQQVDNLEREPSARILLDVFG